MIWLFLVALGGLAAVGVAAWARRSRSQADAEAETRRERNRLDIQERELVAKLRAEQQRRDQDE